MAEQIAIIPNARIALFVQNIPVYIQEIQALFNEFMLQEGSDEPNSPFYTLHDAIINRIVTNNDVILMNWFIDWSVLNDFSVYKELFQQILAVNNRNLFHLICERWDDNHECLSASLDVVGAYVFKNGDNLHLMQDFIAFAEQFHDNIKSFLIHSALIYGRIQCVHYLVMNGAINNIIYQEQNDISDFKHQILYQALIGNNIQCILIIMRNYVLGITLQQYIKILEFAARYCTNNILYLLLRRTPGLIIQQFLSHLLIHAIAFYNVENINMLERLGGIIIPVVVDNAEVLRQRTSIELLGIEEDNYEYDDNHFFDVLGARHNSLLQQNNNINQVAQLLHNRRL
jgi:hypothetical protein